MSVRSLLPKCCLTGRYRTLQEGMESIRGKMRWTKHKHWLKRTSPKRWRVLEKCPGEVLKSRVPNGTCGFDSRPGHQVYICLTTVDSIPFLLQCDSQRSKPGPDDRKCVQRDSECIRPVWNHDSRSAKYLLNAMANCFGSKRLIYFFESALTPNTSWVNFESGRLQRAREDDET